MYGETFYGRHTAQHQLQDVVFFIIFFKMSISNEA